MVPLKRSQPRALKSRQRGRRRGLQSEGFWQRFLGVPTSLCCPHRGGGYVGGGRKHPTDLPVHRLRPPPTRSSSPPQMPPASSTPTPYEKDLGLKIIVTASQQTIQRGHYVPRERPRCCCCRGTAALCSEQARGFCAVAQTLTQKHILTPAYTRRLTQGTPQAHAGAHSSLPVHTAPTH